MSTLVIKNLPENLHDKLRAQAARNHRSVTKEVVTLIESAVASERPEDKLPLHRVLGGRPVTIQELEYALARIDQSAVAEPSSVELTEYLGKWPHYKDIDEVVVYVRELRKDRGED